MVSPGFSAGRAGVDGSVRPGSVATRGRLSDSTTPRTEGVIPAPSVLQHTRKPAEVFSILSGVSNSPRPVQVDAMSRMATSSTHVDIDPSTTNAAASTPSEPPSATQSRKRSKLAQNPLPKPSSTSHVGTSVPTQGEGAVQARLGTPSDKSATRTTVWNGIPRPSTVIPTAVRQPPSTPSAMVATDTYTTDSALAGTRTTQIARQEQPQTTSSSTSTRNSVPDRRHPTSTQSTAVATDTPTPGMAMAGARSTTTTQEPRLQATTGSLATQNPSTTPTLVARRPPTGQNTTTLPQVAASTAPQTAVQPVDRTYASVASSSPNSPASHEHRPEKPRTKSTATSDKHTSKHRSKSTPSTESDSRPTAALPESELEAMHRLRVAQSMGTLPTTTQPPSSESASSTTTSQQNGSAVPTNLQGPTTTQQPRSDSPAPLRQASKGSKRTSRGTDHRNHSASPTPSQSSDCEGHNRRSRSSTRNRDQPDQAEEHQERQSLPPTGRGEASPGPVPQSSPSPEAPITLIGRGVVIHDLRNNPKALSKEGLTWSELFGFGKRHWFQKAVGNYYKSHTTEPSFRIIPLPPNRDRYPRAMRFAATVREVHDDYTLLWERVGESESDSDSDMSCGTAPTKRRADSPGLDHDNDVGPTRNKRCQDPNWDDSSAITSSSSAKTYEQMLRDADQRHRKSLEQSKGILSDAQQMITEQYSIIEQLRNQLIRPTTPTSTNAGVLDDSWPQTAHNILQMDRTSTSNISQQSERSTNDTSASTSLVPRVSEKLLNGNITNLGVEPFTGFKCNNTLNWIRRFEIKCKSALASPLRAFPSYCEDKTYHFLQSIKGLPNIDMISDTVSSLELWQALKIILNNTFTSTVDAQSLIEELYARRQLGGEDVGTYVTELSALGARLVPPWTAAMLKPLLIKGLDTRIFEKFPKLDGSETFNWVIDQARYWEARLEQLGERTIRREAMGTLHVMDPISVDNTDDESSQHRPHLAAFNKFSPRGASGRPNARSSQRGRSDRPTSDRHNRPNRLYATPGEPPYNDKLQCRHCGRVGHGSAHCRQRAAERPAVSRSSIREAPNVKLCSFDKRHSAAVSGFARDADRNWIHSAMLADSGADENFVTAAFAQRLKLKVSTTKTIEYRDGSNKLCNSIGSVKIKIRLHLNVFFHAFFHVIETCPYEVILGPALAICNGLSTFDQGLYDSPEV